MAFPGTPPRKLLLGSSASTAARALGFDVVHDGAGDFFSGLWRLVKTKAAEVAAYLAALFAALSRKADELLPPETRSDMLRRWLYFAVAVALPAALVLYCLARCCCCRRRAIRNRRMMAAPGRGGARMPRDVFEGDPRRYFRDLRAQKPLVY